MSIFDHIVFRLEISHSLGRTGMSNISISSATTRANVASELRFDFNRGSIEFSEKRVALLHLSLYGKLLSELFNAAGEVSAEKILENIGRQEGKKYLDDETFPGILQKKPFGLTDILHLHNVSGLSNPEIVSFSSKEESDFYCELIIHNSFEAEAFKEFCGVSTHPVCCIQVGHLSELVSKCFGRNIVFTEVTCQAMGADVCRVIGKDFSIQKGSPWPSAKRPSEVRRQVQPTEEAVHEGPEIVGSSAHLRLLIDHARKAAATKASILITGETGVGKELVARAVHFLSARSGNPFIAVNCGALPKDLLEAEMFGVAKGAYTGAVGARPGRFERANGGTLFLDEVGTLPMEAQVKLLRALDDGVIERLGDTRERHSDVRVIAATNVDLLAEARAGRFRLDLYQRLAVFPIHVLPLRERREDIGLLVEYYLPRMAGKLGYPVLGITDNAMEYLKRQQWDGNVRELKNRIERAVILSEGKSRIEICHVEFEADHYLSSKQHIKDRTFSTSENRIDDIDGGDALSLTELLNQLGSMQEIEKHVVRAALEQTEGNRSQAAKLLGFTRTQLNYRLRNQASA